MKNKRIAYLLETFIAPAVLVIAGFIMLFNPDSATALISAILAWVFIGISLVIVAGMAFRKDFTQIISWIQVVGCLGLGIYFLAEPLVLAKLAGRVLGLILVIEGIKNVRTSLSDFGKILSVITAVTGAILIFLPLSLSRIIMRILGIVMLGVGAANIVDRVFERRKIDDDDGSDIIDADE